MAIYVWGTGCGAAELIGQGLDIDRIAAFVDSYPSNNLFWGNLFCCRSNWRSVTVIC